MLEKRLAYLAQVAASAPRRLLLLLLIPTAVLAYLAATVPLDLSFAAISPDNDPRIERFFAAIDNFGSASEMLLAVEGQDKKQMKAFAAAVLPKLQNTALVKEATAKQDLDFFKKNSLLFMPPDQLELLSQALQGAGASVVLNPNTETVLEVSKSLLQNTELSGDGDPAQVEKAMSVYGNLMEGIYLALSSPVDEGHLSGIFSNALRGRRPHGDYYIDPDGYFFSPDGSILILRMELAIDPIRLPIGVASMGEVQEAVDETLQDFPGVQASLGGLPAISFEDQSYVVGEVERLSPISLILMLLLFLYVERSVRVPAFVGLCMLVSLVWTFGFVHLIFGHVTAMSAIFGILLFGLGIDYAVHLAARLREEQGAGTDLKRAMATALAKTGPSIVAGAGTTAVAFLSMKAFKMKSTDHLGITTAVGILCCLFMMMTALPALIHLFGKKQRMAQKEAKSPALSAIVSVAVHHPISTLAVAATITVLLGMYIPTMKFQSNLEDIITQDMKSSRAGKLVRERFHLGTDFAMIAVDSVEEARALSESLVKKREIVRVDGIHQLIPANQEASLGGIHALAKKVSQLRDGAGQGAGSESRIRRVQDLLTWHSEAAGEMAGLFEMAELPGLAGARRAQGAAKKTAEYLASGPEGSGARLSFLDAWLSKRLGTWLKDVAAQGEVQPIGPEDLPKQLRSSLVGKNGQYQLRAYPRGSVLSVKAAKRLTKVLPPEATGAHDLATVMVTAGTDRLPVVAVGLLSLISVALIIGFRSGWMALYAVVPLAVGATVALGGLIATGGPVSVLMASAFPLILGIGIDDGIHVVLRWKELRESGVSEPQATLIATVRTGRAILMTTVTTLCGFGVLLHINHAGIRSMASLVCVGVALCFVCSVTVLPAVILVGERLRQKLQSSQR